MPTSPGRSAGCGTRSAAPTPTSWWPSTTPWPTRWCGRVAPAEWDVHTPGIHLRDSRMPLSAARNLGAATAVAAGAEHLVFLDVDCVPSRTLVGRYGEVLVDTADGAGPRVLCGDVAYEPAPPTADSPGGTDRRPRHHPARPSVAAERDSRGRRRLAVLVVVLRRHGPRLHPRRGLRRGLPRVRRRGHRLRPTALAQRGSAALRGRGGGGAPVPPQPQPARAARRRHRRERERLRATSGGGGRCGRGSTSSTSAAWYVVPPTGAGRSPRSPRARVQRRASGGPGVPTS